MANKSPIEDFVGREVYIAFSSTSYLGKVIAPNYETGYVDLQPSVIYSFDGSKAKLEKDLPTRMSLKLFDKDIAYSITPHDNGFLEERVEAINNPAKKENMGFKP